MSRGEETASPSAAFTLCRKTFPGRVRGTADPSTAGRDRSASLGSCDFFNFPCSLWPESSEEHLPTSIAGVLRLRAVNPLLWDRSARRFAPTARRGRQDDTFLEGIKQHLVGCKKHEKIEKVTGSQDDKRGGGRFHLRLMPVELDSRSLRPTQGDEKRSRSSNHSPRKRRPLLCHPERSRGICSSFHQPPMLQLEDELSSRLPRLAVGPKRTQISYLAHSQRPRMRLSVEKDA